MSRQRSKIRRESPQISNVWSLPENNWKMEELFPITTFKKVSAANFFILLLKAICWGWHGYFNRCIFLLGTYPCLDNLLFILIVSFCLFLWNIESTLHLVLRLRGGGKKRKKKNYTTPKKIKHKHKKVKLSVLKYYRVDDNGKIHRLRRECPAEECGAGIFMAAHFDRQYCGKCGLTYVYNPIEEK